MKLKINLRRILILRKILIFDKLDKKNQKIFGEFINYLEDELPAQQISIDVIDGKID